MILDTNRWFDVTSSSDDISVESFPSFVAAGGTAEIKVKISPNANGNVSETLTIESNDADEANFELGISYNVESTTPTATADEVLAQNTKLYPNPTTDVFTVEVEGAEGDVQVYVYTAAGKLVTSGTLSSNPIDISTYPSGTYIVKIVSGDAVAVKRVTKK